MKSDIIENYFLGSIKTKKSFLTPENIKNLIKVADWMKKSLKSSRTLLICGNGGSFADAQHIAAELVGRFKNPRPALPAICLGTNLSSTTAIGNDYGFQEIFRRQVEAFGKRNGLFIGISTSGNSINVINAVSKAKEIGMKTVILTGKVGGKLKSMADIVFCVPSDYTPHIQETHIVIGHILCLLIDKRWNNRC